jgi:Type IV pilin-like G and H, putative
MVNQNKIRVKPICSSQVKYVVVIFVLYLSKLNTMLTHNKVFVSLLSLSLCYGLSACDKNIKVASSQEAINQDISQSVQNRYNELQVTKIQNEGIMTIRLLNRVQSNFYNEKKHFNQDYENLYIGLPQESQNYSYSIHSSNDKDFVQNIGVAKDTELKSYLGLTVLLNQSTGKVVKSTLCSSNNSSKINPVVSHPEINNGSIVCPAGYTEVVGTKYEEAVK